MKRPTILLSALALGTAAFLAPVASSQAAPDVSSGPTLSGIIYAATGAPMVGATVQLAVLGDPDPSGVLRPITYAETITDDEGRYVVPTTIPDGLRSGSDQEQVQVTASKGLSAVTFDYLVDTSPSAASSRSATRLALVQDSLSLRMRRGEVAASPGTSGLARAATAAADDGDVREGPPAAGDPDLDDGVPPLVSRGGDSNCRSTYQAVWVPQFDKTVRRWIPIQKIATRAHSSQTYEYETTERTTMETAYTGDGGSYAGGLSASKEQESSLGVRLSSGNRLQHVVKVEWEFLQYRKMCSQPWSGGNKYYLDVYNWRPNERTGGSKKEESVPQFDCNNSTTVVMGVETWVARSSAVVYNGWFSIGSVKLDARQSNSSSHKLTVKPDAGEEDPRICGDNAYPASADRIKERID